MIYFDTFFVVVMIGAMIGTTIFAVTGRRK